MTNLEQLPEIQALLKHFAFTYEKDNEDHYFCRCGEHFSAEMDELAQIESVTDIVEEDQKEFLEEFESMFNDIKMAVHQGTTCPSCGVNYVHPSYKHLLVREHEKFASGWHMDSTDTQLQLYHYNVEYVPTDDAYELKVSHRMMAFDKEGGKVYYTGDGEPQFEVDLCDVMPVVQDFFGTTTKHIMGLHELHHFINSLANFVPDSDGIHVMEEIIREVQGKQDAGYEHLQKVFAIFIAIRIYSNLSTLAMTKGAQFLYDVINRCHLPTLQDIQEAGVTAPLPIFNFLIQNYIDIVNDEIQGEDRSSKDFIYKSDVEIVGLDTENDTEEDMQVEVRKGEEREMTIKVRSQRAYEKALQLARAQRGQVKGEMNVKERIADGSISKFIFKRIDSFGEYEKLIRFYKFIDNRKLIALMQKWPKEFLVAIIDRIYHRRECDDKEMAQIFAIINSFVEQQSKKYADVDPETGKIVDRLNYAFVEDFDFAFYDDSLMAIEYLYRIVDEKHKKNFVRSKYFNKIKDFDALVKFHDGIITQQNYFAKSEDGDSGALKEIVDKYRWIESTEGYDGPVRVKILDSFEEFVAEGQEMDHSAGRYAHKTLDEEMLVCKLLIKGKPMTKDEQLRYTLGLVIDYYDGIVFDALKGVGNAHASDRVIKEVRDWLEHKEIAIRRITDIKYRGDDTLNLDEVDL